MQGARGHQTSHGGREGLGSLSAAASRLLAMTQLRRAQLLLSSGAAWATLTLAGAVTATPVPTDRPGLYLRRSFGATTALRWERRWSPSAVGLRAAQNGAGPGGGGRRRRPYGRSPLDGKLRPARSLHLCPSGAMAAPCAPGAQRGVRGCHGPAGVGGAPCPPQPG